MNAHSAAAAAAPVDADAAEILALEQVGPLSFTGRSGARNHSGAVFGGRLVAQSLHAALRTVDPGLPPSSLHANFLAAGRTDLPLEYRVIPLRDSRRFANRQVMVEQAGTLVFTLLASFHAPEPGYVHQAEVMPPVPGPAAVPSVQEFVARHAGQLDPAAIRNFSGPLPVELRPVAAERYFLGRPSEPTRELWFRVPGAEAIDDPRLQACLAAFASDYWLAGTAAVPHAFPTNTDTLLISSLDHAMWFHQPISCADWLLHSTRSPAASQGLGLGLGRIFDRDGRLLASTAQECLLRPLCP